MTLEEAMAIAEEYMKKCPGYEGTFIKTASVLGDIYIFRPLLVEGGGRLGLYEVAVLPDGTAQMLAPGNEPEGFLDIPGYPKVIKEF